MIKIDENKHEKIHIRQIKVTTYDTCRVWRKDGPKLEEYRKKFKDNSY
jgi:hypothetical protein